jgi:hypothetical protein
LPIFNRRFYRVYHDIPLEVRPTETFAMIYYIIGLHSELSLPLVEQKSPSLIQLFEDAREVEENIHASRKIQDRDLFENLQVHEQLNCQYILDSEQKSNEDEVDKEQQPEGEYISDSEKESSKYEADKEQQLEGEYMSDSELDFSVWAEYSRDRYACEVYDQFVNQEEPMMIDDCIGNYVFLTDPCSYDFNTVL